MKINDIILNIPFEEIFFQTSKINYIREDSQKNIDKKELLKIMKEIESQSLKKHYTSIRNTSGYKKKDIRLII
jgi:hypothetical protein